GPAQITRVLTRDEKVDSNERDDEICRRFELETVIEVYGRATLGVATGLRRRACAPRERTVHARATRFATFNGIASRDCAGNQLEVLQQRGDGVRIKVVEEAVSELCAQLLAGAR